jgi:hypothetical protein
MRSASILRASIAIGFALGAQPAAAQSADELKAILASDAPDSNLQLQVLLAPIADDRKRIDALLAQAGFELRPVPGDCRFFYYHEDIGRNGLYRHASVTLCQGRPPLVLAGRGYPIPAEPPRPGDPNTITTPVPPRQ